MPELPIGHPLLMTKRLTGWPGVVDTSLQVGGRPVRVLRARGRGEGGGERAAEPQLLVHGLGGSSVTWVEVMTGLAEHGPVVAVDLPGFGRTPPTGEDALTVDGYVDFVLDVADALGWDSFALHGNSMGGLVATFLAAREPARVTRLVLVSPALPPRLPVSLLLPSRATIDGMVPIAVSSAHAAAFGLLGIAGPELSQRRDRALLSLIYPDPDGIDRRVLSLMAADFADDTMTARQRRRAMLSALRSITACWTDPRAAWRAVRRVQAPTLVIGGTHDALVPARTLRAVLADRPQWQGHVLDERRHALMMEDPERYLELVARWREGTRRAA